MQYLSLYGKYSTKFLRNFRYRYRYDHSYRRQVKRDGTQNNN